MGTVREVAEVIEFLLEPRSEYINDETIVVDGGLTTVSPPFLHETPWGGGPGAGG
jgi:enoyl-[acyl-carrier protein] reductase III